MPFFYMPNLPSLPFGLDGLFAQPMQEMNPQPWENPGGEPDMQGMNEQPWTNPGNDPDLQEMNELDQPFDENWGVYDEDGNPVFDIDTCIDFKFGDEAKVSDFPVEQGAFASFNKVVKAFQPKIRLAVSGQERIAALLVALADAVRSTDIYDVYTPEINYSSVTVEKYDYSRTKDKGRSMLEVEVTLMQVKQVSAQYTTVKLPAPKKKAAADGKNGGKAQTVQPPTPPPIEQQNAAMAAKLGIPAGSLGVHP